MATLLWRKTKFMHIFKLESQTMDEVTKVFKKMQELISYEDYKNYFKLF